MSYTKGPRKVVENRDDQTSWLIKGIKGSCGNQLAQVANFQDVSFEINAEGNAQLISCAPELLKALKEVHGENYLGHYVDDLIARAEGRLIAR